MDALEVVLLIAAVSGWVLVGVLMWLTNDTLELAGDLLKDNRDLLDMVSSPRASD